MYLLLFTHVQKFYPLLCTFSHLVWCFIHRLLCVRWCQSRKISGYGTSQIHNTGSHVCSRIHCSSVSVNGFTLLIFWCEYCLSCVYFINHPLSWNPCEGSTSPGQLGARDLLSRLKFKIMSHLPWVRNQSLIIDTIMCLNEVIICKNIIHPVLYDVSINMKYSFIMSEPRALINLLHSIYISTMSETQYLCACL